MLLNWLDFFAKSTDDAKRRSWVSGLVSVCLYCVVLLLFVRETHDFFFTVRVENEVGVDTRLLASKLQVHFDIDFPGLACHEFGLDAVDTAGEQQLELSDNMRKRPLPRTHKGGSDGCRIDGTLRINRVKGEFHVAFGRQAVASSGDSSLQKHHIHRFSMAELDTFNASHAIRRLAFGEEYPGVHNPLDGVEKMIRVGSRRFLYFIKVVPTEYHFLNGTVLHTNQYAYTEHEIPVNTHARRFYQPGFYAKYELAPYSIRHREVQKRTLEYITTLCALIGGAWVVGGLFSSAIVALLDPKQQIVNINNAKAI